MASQLNFLKHRLEVSYNIKHFPKRFYSLLYDYMQSFELRYISMYPVELLPKTLIESSRVI